jgi:hypothetical protein
MLHYSLNSNKKNSSIGLNAIFFWPSKKGKELHRRNILEQSTSLDVPVLVGFTML